MPACSSTCRSWPNRARPASACSAPSCSSWSPRPSRAPRRRSGSIATVLDAAGGRPVTFRTLDIGGDKVLPYFKSVAQEENPALGWRAIRLGLDRPGLLRTQVRALLKAAGGRELRLMLPMVTEVGEIMQARELIDREVRHLSPLRARSADAAQARRHGRGAVAAVAARRADARRSISSRSAPTTCSSSSWPTDRGNTQLADRFDPLSRAVPARAQADRRRRRPRSVPPSRSAASSPAGRSRPWR